MVKKYSNYRSPNKQGDRGHHNAFLKPSGTAPAARLRLTLGAFQRRSTWGIYVTKPDACARSQPLEDMGMRRMNQVGKRRSVQSCQKRIPTPCYRTSPILA